VKDYSDKAAPLNELLKKGVEYKWTPDRQKAFEILKNALVSQPILSYPTRRDPFILDTDCSNFALGSVLSQVQNGKEKVIAYCSKNLNECQRHYCATKRELYAIKYSVQHFKPFLRGRPFLIRTDHSALIWLKKYREGDDTMTRWNYELQGYDFTIEHRAGSLHGNADGLSRITVRCPRPECPDCRQLAGKPLPGRKTRISKTAESESDGDKGESDFDYCADDPWESSSPSPPEDSILCTAIGEVQVPVITRQRMQQVKHPHSSATPAPRPPRGGRGGHGMIEPVPIARRRRPRMQGRQRCPKPRSPLTMLESAAGHGSRMKSVRGCGIMQKILSRGRRIAIDRKSVV
jgi:hypothetical protein